MVEDRERNEQKECDAEGRETKGEEREQAERKGTGLLKCRYVGKRSKTMFI